MAASKCQGKETSLSILKLNITWEEMARIYYNTGFKEETNREHRDNFSLGNQVKKDEDQQAKGEDPREERISNKYDQSTLYVNVKIKQNPLFCRIKI